MTILTGQEGLAFCTVTGAALLTTGTTVFTIAGGPIRITDLLSYCTVTDTTVASTLKWTADGTVGAATDITGASASLSAITAGSLVYCSLTALNTAPVVAATGVAIAGMTTSTGGGVFVPAGVIKMTIGTGDGTTALFKHYMRWVPLRPDVSVTAAF